MAIREPPSARAVTCGTEQQVGASFEQNEGATGPVLARYLASGRTPASLGTLSKTRSGGGDELCRDEAWRGRAGQAVKLGEPGVVDGTTANSLAASYRGPRQDGRVAKTKLLARNCLRILDQGLGPTRAHSRTNRPLEKARHDGRARSRVGWTSPPLTPDGAHFAANTRSGR